MSDAIGEILVMVLMAIVFFLGFAIGNAGGHAEARIDEAQRWCAQNPSYAPAFRVNGKDARCVEGRLYFTEAGDA